MSLINKPPEENRHSWQITRIKLLCISLAVLIFAVYAKTATHNFINFDDEAYVTQNPHVATGLTLNNILWAFKSCAVNWHPVTWISHMMDVQLFGLNAGGHHLVNVIVHTISTLILFIFLCRYTESVWKSFFVAALFAMHPLHVESVAWVAERKDVLSAMFFFAAVFAYCEYIKTGINRYHHLCLAMFILGLMSKPMLVTLPVILILLDIWPLKRFQLTHDNAVKTLMILIKEKLPFFALSLASGIITIYAQRSGGAVRSLHEVPLGLRLENAVVSYVTYLLNIFWPHDLAVLYPIKRPSLLVFFGALLILMAISMALFKHGKKSPAILAGWLWYVITLLPVIGILQVGSQAMADRYTYIPAIGIFIIIAWGTPLIPGAFKYRQQIIAFLYGIVLVALTGLTWRQLDYWKSEIILYKHTLSITENNYVIHNNLGNALTKNGNYAEAIQEYNAVLHIQPDDIDAHYNLGYAYLSLNDLNAAEKELLIAVRLTPQDKDAHNNLGAVYVKKGELDKAIIEFGNVLKLNPDNKSARNNLRIALSRKKPVENSINQSKTR